jgi:Protein of unknown function (DUF3108)
MARFATLRAIARVRGCALAAVLFAAAMGRAASTPTVVPTPLALPNTIDVPDYKPGAFPFHDNEELIYQASWLGIPAADARILVHHNGPAIWRGEAWIKTNKLVDILFKMRDYLREDFGADGLAPREMVITQHENRQNNLYRVTFDPAEHMVTMVKRNRRGHIEKRRFHAHNPCFPFSGSMLALSQSLNVGDRYTFDVFGGSNRYVIDFSVARRERISTPLGQIDALRVVPRVLYLANNDERKTAREVTVWISADQRRLPLRIEASAFIGKLRIDLLRVSDGGKAPKPAAAPVTTAPASLQSQTAPSGRP